MKWPFAAQIGLKVANKNLILTPYKSYLLLFRDVKGSSVSMTKDENRLMLGIK